MLRIRHILLFVIALHMSTASNAQWSAVEFGGMAGNMLDIYPGMPKHDLQKSSFGVLRWGGMNPYRELYGYPEQGLMLSFHDLGNQDVLGYATGLQYQLSFNKYFTRRWRGFSRLNIGAVHVSKPYHYIDNPDNNVFGSRFSALITASAGIRYKFIQSAITLQASYWHSSNAHTVLPNVGMNTPMVMLGFERFFWLEDIGVMDTTHRPFSLPAQFGAIIRFGYGLNEAGGTVRPTNGDQYNKYLVSAGVSYRYKTIHRLSLTLEGYHDQTYALWNETMQWNQDRPFLGSSALMLMLGHEYIYGNIGLVIQGGVNIYNPTLGRLIGEVEQPTFSNKMKRYVPGRFALRYYITKDEHYFSNFFVQIAVKSNTGQADFMEIGLGTILSERQAEKTGSYRLKFPYIGRRR